jgi:hypothetical protein
VGIEQDRRAVAGPTQSGNDVVDRGGDSPAAPLTPDHCALQLGLYAHPGQGVDQVVQHRIVLLRADRMGLAGDLAQVLHGPLGRVLGSRSRVRYDLRGQLLPDTERRDQDQNDQHQERGEL